jgi:CubicO group peptidase (beta-lactamase class C family)
MKTTFLILGWMVTITADAAFGLQPMAQTQLMPPDRMGDTAVVEDLRSEMDRLSTETRFSGAILLAKGDNILFENAYGLADRAGKRPNDVTTKFNTASMAKLFTATSILQFAQEGKLSLDDPLIKVLPDYPNKEAGSKITVRQVLMHRSGLGDYVGREWAQTDPAKLQIAHDYLPFFADKPLLFEPGTQYSYSNAGMLVIGLIVERLSGERFERCVHDHVFKPAGMTDSGYYSGYARGQDIANLAIGYANMGVRPGEPPRPMPQSSASHGAEAAGVGAFTTVEDLMRFSRAIQQGKLLDRRYTDSLVKHEPVETPEQYHDYGWEHRYVNGAHLMGHVGNGPGMNACLWIYPDLGYTVAVLSNCEGGAELVAGRIQTRLTSQEVPRAIHLSADALKKFEGRYGATGPLPPGVGLMTGPPPGAVSRAGQSAGGGVVIMGGSGGGMTRPSITITADGDALRVSLPQLGIHKFLPLSPGDFFDADVLGGRLTFTMGSGHVTGLRITGISFSPTVAEKLL